MNKSKCLILAVALGMMAATAGYLVTVHKRLHLGAPGVKVGPAIIYDDLGHPEARRSVVLPEEVLGIKGSNGPVSQGELDSLPKDTSFGRMIYRGKDGFGVVASVVLMGSDRSSIHQPQFCLEAQAWRIQQTEPIRLRMDRPYPYQLPALKLRAVRMIVDEYKQPVAMRGIYVYWFVSGDKITSDQGTRMWSLAKTMLEKGELERWAYISYFTTCLPGREDATYEQLERFIRASAPQFQTVAGQPSAGRLPVAAR